MAKNKTTKLCTSLICWFCIWTNSHSLFFVVFNQFKHLVVVCTQTIITLHLKTMIYLSTIYKLQFFFVETLFLWNFFKRNSHILRLSRFFCRKENGSDIGKQEGTKMSVKFSVSEMGNKKWKWPSDQNILLLDGDHSFSTNYMFSFIIIFILYSR